MIIFPWYYSKYVCLNLEGFQISKYTCNSPIFKQKSEDDLYSFQNIKNMNTTESDITGDVNAANVLSSYECFLIAFVLGAVAATFAKCVSAPFERVKLFQQCLYAQYSETKE